MFDIDVYFHKQIVNFECNYDKFVLYEAVDIVCKKVYVC